MLMAMEADGAGYGVVLNTALAIKLYLYFSKEWKRNDSQTDNKSYPA
jgi:hypothetical protein